VPGRGSLLPQMGVAKGREVAGSGVKSMSQGSSVGGGGFHRGGEEEEEGEEEEGERGRGGAV